MVILGKLRNLKPTAVFNSKCHMGSASASIDGVAGQRRPGPYESMNINQASIRAKNILPLIISFLVLSLVILAGKLFYRLCVKLPGVVLFSIACSLFPGFLCWRMLYRGDAAQQPNVICPRSWRYDA